MILCYMVANKRINRARDQSVLTVVEDLAPDSSYSLWSRLLWTVACARGKFFGNMVLLGIQGGTCF